MQNSDKSAIVIHIYFVDAVKRDIAVIKDSPSQAHSICCVIIIFHNKYAVGGTNSCLSLSYEKGEGNVQLATRAVRVKPHSSEVHGNHLTKVVHIKQDFPFWNSEVCKPTWKILIKGGNLS